jgi:hypothetical protein
MAVRLVELRAQGAGGRSRVVLRWVLAALVLWMAGCASTSSPSGSARRNRPYCPFGNCGVLNQGHRNARAQEAGAAPQARGEVGPIEARHVKVDHLAGLLVRAGVAPAHLPKQERELSPQEAARLLNRVLAAPVALKDFGPWSMAVRLLVGVAQGNKSVERGELYERMRRFNELLVLRPDGYLVRATTGRAVQHAGEVEWQGEALRAEGFEVGHFYQPRKGMLYPVDSALDIHPDAVLAGVYVPDEGTLGPMLEGMNQALEDTVGGLIALVVHPVDSLEGLARLPATVRTLVENAPGYAEYLEGVTHGERVRVLARLVTNVALVCASGGAAGARVARVGSQLGGLSVPVLSVSAQGALMLERAVVPVGSMVTAVSGAPGGLYIVHMASRGAGGSGGKGWRPPPGGPGRWVPKNEGMKPRARQYQEQVTGVPEGWAYRVEHAGERADFDAFSGTKLVEAKGLGYEKFLDEDLVPMEFFEGFREMLETARRQSRVAQGTPIQWSVAEKRLGDYLTREFERMGLNIDVVHVPFKK